MAWYAVHETLSGRLVSVGQQVADPLPANCSALLLLGAPTQNDMWDPTLKAFVARPAKTLRDRLDDLAANADFKAVWDTLTDTQKATMRKGIVWLLGRRRYRPPGEAAQVDG